MTYALTIYHPKDYPHVTEAEAEAIWLEARTRVRVFVKVLWFTGLRLNEVLKLKARDLSREGLDFSLTVTRSKKRKPKPEQLPIPRQLGLDLDDYIEAADIKPSAKLFPGHENSYRYQLKQCARRAGLPNWPEIHPHSFRHGFIYHKASQGVHPFLLSWLSGHSSPQVTFGYYRPSLDDMRRAMEV